MPEKKAIVNAILARLNEELSVLVQAARAAHEAATHEESRSEDKHDTRGLEASYLAGAQAGRAAELQKQIGVLRQLPLRDWNADDAVAVGALVELKSGSKTSFYFLIGFGGGISVQCQGQTVHIITPGSPLGEALLGRRLGDEIEVESQKTLREYELIGLS